MRKQGWERNFSTWVEQVLRRKFAWGHLDCGLMVAECVEVITGTHPVPELVGAYFSPIGAARILLES